MSDLSILVVCLLQIFWKLPASTVKVSQSWHRMMSHLPRKASSSASRIPGWFFGGYAIWTGNPREIHLQQNSWFFGTLPLRCSMVLITFWGRGSQQIIPDHQLVPSGSNVPKSVVHRSTMWLGNSIAVPLLLILREYIYNPNRSLSHQIN